MPVPLNIVHVVLSLNVGGLERIVLNLIGESRRLGQRVSIVCLERPGTLAPEAEAMGVPVACVAKPPGFRPETVARILPVLRGLHPDVVHTHQIGALFYAGPAARGCGVPVIVHTEHGKHQEYALRLRNRLIGRFAGRFAGRFFCVSHDMARVILAHRIVPKHKIHVTRNGTDAGRFVAGGGAGELRASLGIPSDAWVVGTVGRLDDVKRQDVLIEGFARLAEHVPGAHLLVVGDGPRRGELRDLAGRLGLGGRAHFVGYQPQPERYLGAMDVFALTSRSEGMPVSVLEAWATGVPVVASRVGGLPEMLDADRYGLLFEPGNPVALASALGDLLLDRDRAHQLAEAGRSRVESEFSLRRMADEYHRHYLELRPEGR